MPVNHFHFFYFHHLIIIIIIILIRTIVNLNCELIQSAKLFCFRFFFSSPFRKAFVFGFKRQKCIFREINSNRLSTDHRSIFCCWFFKSKQKQLILHLVEHLPNFVNQIDFQLSDEWRRIFELMIFDNNAIHALLSLIHNFRQTEKWFKWIECVPFVIMMSLGRDNCSEWH